LSASDSSSPTKKKHAGWRATPLQHARPALLLVRSQAGGELPARLDRLADTLRLLVRYSSYINYDYSLRKVPALITELLLPVTNLSRTNSRITSRRVRSATTAM
jgi:hypothetical protein